MVSWGYFWLAATTALKSRTTSAGNSLVTSTFPGTWPLLRNRSACRCCALTTVRSSGTKLGHHISPEICQISLPTAGVCLSATPT